MWRNTKPYLAVVPAVAMMSFLFIGGLWLGIQQSVEGEGYQRLFAQDDFWLSLGLTFQVACLSTLSAGMVGIAMTLLLLRLQRMGVIRRISAWLRLFQLPLTVPHFVASYFIVVMWMQSGWVARLFYLVGWIQEPAQFPVLVNDLQGWGIIMTYVWKEAPFILLMLYPVSVRIEERWREVAQVLGAGRKEFFRYVTLPLLLPAWLYSCLIVFAFTFSAFEVPFLLGVTYPQLLPVLAYQLYAHGELTDRPEALAINLLLALVTAGVGGLAYLLGRRFRSTGWNEVG